MGYCGIALISVWVNIRSGYCRDGRMSGRASVCELVSGQVTVRSGYCPVELLYSWVTICPVRASVWLGYFPDTVFNWLHVEPKPTKTVIHRCAAKYVFLKTKRKIQNAKFIGKKLLSQSFF